MSILGKFFVIFCSVMMIGSGTLFNSCSPVNFSAEKAVIKPLCQNPPCDDDPTIVNHRDIYNVPPYSNKTDIFLVLDNSGSMDADLLKLANKLDGLINILDAGSVDWQMCYTTTDVNALAGRALTWLDSAPGGIQDTGQIVLKSSTANPTSKFLVSINNLPSNGSGNERGIEAAHLALDASENASCIRNDAALAIILISDEDERSCGGRCETWTASEIGSTDNRAGTEYARQYSPLLDIDMPANLVSFVNSNWSVEKPFIVHSIVIRPGDNACYAAQDAEAPAFFGKLYADLQSSTGGVLGDICAGSYANQLEEMGERTRDAINSITLKGNCTPLSTPVVTVTSPPTGLTWSFAGNKVLFSAPIDGLHIEVAYSCLQ
jgi:hypothetical protein